MVLFILPLTGFRVINNTSELSCLCPSVADIPVSPRRVPGPRGSCLSSLNVLPLFLGSYTGRPGSRVRGQASAAPPAAQAVTPCTLHVGPLQPFCWDRPCFLWHVSISLMCDWPRPHPMPTRPLCPGTCWFRSSPGFDRLVSRVQECFLRCEARGLRVSSPSLGLPFYFQRCLTKDIVLNFNRVQITRYFL